MLRRPGDSLPYIVATIAQLVEQLLRKQQVVGSIPTCSIHSRVVELVDTLALGASAARRGGSNPPVRTMTQDKIKEVCERYQDALIILNNQVHTGSELVAEEFTEEQMDSSYYTLPISKVLSHLLFVFATVPTMTWDPGKQGRWLGWAQGVLFALGLQTDRKSVV